MNEKELIKRALKVRGKTQLDLAKEYGYTSQGAIGDILNRSASVRINLFTKLMDLLNFDVYVLDRETGEYLGRVTSSLKGPNKESAEKRLKTLEEKGVFVRKNEGVEGLNPEEVSDEVQEDFKSTSNELQEVVQEVVQSEKSGENEAFFEKPKTVEIPIFQYGKKK